MTLPIVHTGPAPDRADDRTLDEAIVTNWFSIIADRFGRTLDRVTARQYLTTFDTARVTSRGLNGALQEVFDTATRWPAPGEIVMAAYRVEAQYRAGERIALPPMSKVDQARATTDAEWDTKKAEAAAWAAAFPESAKHLRRYVAAEYCQRCKVASVKALSPFQRDAYRAALVQHYRAASTGSTFGLVPPADDVSEKDPPISDTMKQNGPSPDVPAAETKALAAKLAEGKAKHDASQPRPPEPVASAVDCVVARAVAP